MFYAWDIIIPANTQESAPEKQILKITIGIIKSINIKFPAGCNGMVKVRIKRWTSQLIPLTSNQWVIGDDELVPTEQYYLIDSEPFELNLEACSPSTIYDHKITVRIDLEALIDSTEDAILSELQKLNKQVSG